MTDDRFYVKTRPTLIELYRAVRRVFERRAAANGETLAPSWYQDSPEDQPHLYVDQPHLLPPGTDIDALRRNARQSGECDHPVSG